MIHDVRMAFDESDLPTEFPDKDKQELILRIRKDNLNIT